MKILLLVDVSDKLWRGDVVEAEPIREGLQWCVNDETVFSGDAIEVADDVPPGVSQYTGKRVGDSFIVLYDGKKLPLRLDLRGHNPDGFNWGYGGSGPAQLALALLAHAVGDELALRYYQSFKWAVIALLPSPGWIMTVREVRVKLVEIICEGGVM